MSWIDCNCTCDACVVLEEHDEHCIRSAENDSVLEEYSIWLPDQDDSWDEDYDEV